MELSKFKKKLKQERGHLIWIGGFNKAQPCLQTRIDGARVNLNIKPAMLRLFGVEVRTINVRAGCGVENCVHPNCLVLKGGRRALGYKEAVIDLEAGTVEVHAVRAGFFDGLIK